MIWRLRFLLLLAPQCILINAKQHCQFRLAHSIALSVRLEPLRIIVVAVDLQRQLHACIRFISIKEYLRYSNLGGGKRPLQGIKLLVRMATSRSRGESMIRQPVTPTALQPRPMHMVCIIMLYAPTHGNTFAVNLYRGDQTGNKQPSRL